MSIDGLSLSCLITELHNKLIGGRIERIFQNDSHSLLIWVRQVGEDLPLVISVNPTCPKIHLTENVPENPAVPPNFCMLLRKHLEDGRIAQITQHSLDRIVIISVDIRGAGGLIVTKELVIELMGKHSNIIFTVENKIIDAIKRIGANTSRYRQVLPGREYFYPPGQERLNLLETPTEVFLNFLFNEIDSNKKNPLAKQIIAAAMGIGPFTAREITWRAGLDSDISLPELDVSDRQALGEAIDSIIKPLKEGLTTPLVALDTNPRDLDTDEMPVKQTPLAVSAFELEHLSPQRYVLKKFESMNIALEFFSRNQNEGRPTLPNRDFLSKLISGELSRLTRKKNALSQELSEAENGVLFRRCADILMINIYNIPAGSPSVTLPDIYHDSSGGQNGENTITIELDPHMPIVANAQAYYEKYNKSKRALENLSHQLKLCLEEIEYLESVDLALGNALTGQEVSDIRQELIAAKYLPVSSTIKGTGSKGKSRHSRPAPSKVKEVFQPLTAQTSDGFLVLIGKNNHQNDLVTFKHSHPDDIWLHTKDIPGSHIILKTNKQTVPDSSLFEAAQIAAYFSKAKSSANVPVDYTLRRFVRKPAGARPGFVYYENQTTLYITPEEDVVMRFINYK